MDQPQNSCIENTLQPPQPMIDIEQEKVMVDLKKLPKVTDSEFRLACNDIAEYLSKKVEFKRAIFWRILGALVVLALAVGGLTGWGLSNQLQNLRSDVDRKIGDAKSNVEAQIKEEFKSEKIRATIEKVGSEQAAALISSSVQPSIDSFKQESGKKYDELNKFISNQQEAIKNDQQELKVELAKLKRVNEIRALADSAIARGDLGAYLELEDRAKNDGEDFNPALAELLRVFEAYSIFAPNRLGGTFIPPEGVAKINPKKHEESELDFNELQPFLHALQGFGKAKIASLMRAQVKEGSYRQASIIIDELKTEKHLAVIQQLKAVFNKIAKRDIQGKLHQKDEVEWWEKHKDEFLKNDTEKK